MSLNKPFIHPKALVETNRIGQETKIWALCMSLRVR